ncbi:unnamed protein product [Anisakis simplex]|uniref:Conserved oligomeric Golgi complex subunit 5 n=1 Tax=Anisakis simplex TaxID=6269 RepID=A0A0M3K619_ANISI|nr:unnamed protein product [Anisakis simplex]
MLKEVEEEASKLVSAKFDDALWLMKASEELDKMKDQLNESSYKAKVLVLNAQILDRISCMDAISVRNDRILTLINKLDSTIKESDRLARTPALDHFQAYAKCLLFERIGDYLISRHSRAPNEYGITGEGDVTYGLGSYMLALNALLHSTPVTPRLAAVCARDILILHTILCNSSPDLISTAEKLINNKQIGEKLLNVLQKGQIGHSHALSYVSTVTSCVYTKKLGSSMEQYASMSFMDNFLQVLPDEPDSSSLQQIDERSLSRKDVKVLLIAYSKWISLEWESSAKYKTFNAIKMIPPPFVSVLLPSAINKFWIALLQRLDDAKQS